MKSTSIEELTDLGTASQANFQLWMMPAASQETTLFFNFKMSYTTPLWWAYDFQGKTSCLRSSSSPISPRAPYIMECSPTTYKDLISRGICEKVWTTPSVLRSASSTALLQATAIKFSLNFFTFIALSSTGISLNIFFSKWHFLIFLAPPMMITSELRISIVIQSSAGSASFCSRDKEVKPGTIQSYVTSNFLKMLSRLRVKIYGLSTDIFNILISKNDMFGLSDKELVLYTCLSESPKFTNLTVESQEPASKKLLTLHNPQAPGSISMIYLGSLKFTSYSLTHPFGFRELLLCMLTANQFPLMAHNRLQGKLFLLLKQESGSNFILFNGISGNCQVYSNLKVGQRSISVGFTENYLINF